MNTDWKALPSTVEARKFYRLANQISEHHVKKGFFESAAAALARKVRLRTEIYEALCRAAHSAALEWKDG